MKREIIRKSKVWLKILKNSGFRSPYQIISDNTFIKAVNKRNMSPFTFKNFFKDDPKFFMTKCTYEAHKPHLIDKDFSGSCEIIKCGHEEATSSCAYDIIKEGNPHHYILATNNLVLLSKYKESKNLPLLRLIKSGLKLECNQLSSNVKQIPTTAASKGELKRLKKMYD